jgi:hypothetical protein
MTSRTTARAPQVSEWTNPRSHVVPANTPVTVPDGYRWCSTMIRRTVTRQASEVVIAPEDWGPAVAPLVRMVVAIPAIACRGMVEGEAWPASRRMYSRRPSFWHLKEGGKLRVCAVSLRFGEVLFAPMAEVDGPRTLGLTTGKD